MMWIAYIVLAAFLNAVMDLLENENFSSSVFRNLNPKFWYKRESWKYAKRIGGYKVDGWHLAKSAMIICFAFAIVSYDPLLWWVDILLIGLVWNVVFNLSYKALKNG